MAEAMESVEVNQCSTSTTGAPSTGPYQNRPTCAIVLGMAGSGKTTLVAALSKAIKNKPYLINLDPACLNLPYFTNIDIKDTVNYKEVMKQYNLGPNGAIVTSLNLFSTKFSDVIDYISKSPSDTCVLDTPGQIEVFTWSVSGTIITETLASTYPTVILYVIDTVRSSSPTTFISNMLHACSVLYRTRLPLVLVMNKCDVVGHKYALEWMRDFEAFHRALDADEGYVTNLTRSMALALDEFYRNLKVCGVSAATGEGMEELVGAIGEAREEYERDYKAEWEKMRVRMEKRRAEEKESGTGTGEMGKDLSDVYLRHPGDYSSTDSEGEERPYQDVEDGKEMDDDDDLFKKVLQKQREMQVKRAKEAEERKTTTE